MPEDGDYPVDLPLLGAFLRSRRKSGRGRAEPLRSCHALFVQHHLGPLPARLEAMFELGLDPRNCWFVDIPYSTNRYVWESLRALGCPGAQTARPFNHPLEPYDAAQLERTQSVIRDIARAAPARMLVVDDGAYFLKALAALKIGAPDVARRFGPAPDQTRVCVVEQTTRGYRYVRTDACRSLLEELEAPLVTMARAFTKVCLEGVFIGEAVAAAVRSQLIGMGAAKQAAVLGYGVVGGATVEALEDLALDIDVIEPDISKHESIVAAGVRPLPSLPGRREGSERYDAVVGCTGYGSLAPEDRHLLRDRAHLMSGSSAAIEFNRAAFIERGCDDEFEPLTLRAPEIDPETSLDDDVNYSIREPLVFEHGDADANPRAFTFLNAGFPVNFQGSIECLPAALIQPTHGLLYAAALEASERLDARVPGLVRLNAEDDMWLFVEGVRQIDNERLWA